MMSASTVTRTCAKAGIPAPEGLEETLVDLVYDAVASAWAKATGADPPEETTAFNAACWRVATWIDDFEPAGGVDGVAIVCHAQSWAARRGHWEIKPERLCDWRSDSKRYVFWLIDRAEAIRQGESLDAAE